MVLRRLRLPAIGRNPSHTEPIGIRMGTFNDDSGIRPRTDSRRPIAPTPRDSETLVSRRQYLRDFARAGNSTRTSSTHATASERWDDITLVPQHRDAHTLTLTRDLKPDDVA
jgi:hypothetical protein